MPASVRQTSNVSNTVIAAVRPLGRSTEHVAILTETVTACFERVLQRAPVGHQDNFFDLGGDSLLALSLLAEVKSATGRELPLAAIYDAATITDMVAVLERDGVPEFNALVPFNSGGITPAIFMVHGIFGNVIELLELSKHMPTGRAIYGLQPRGLDGKEPPFDRVEAMAEYYVQAITRVQAHGPYVLVGYSFGGLVAMEMALRLRARGDEIAFLCFIDTYPSPRCWPIASHLGVWGRKSLHWGRVLARMRPAKAMSIVWRRASSRSHRGLRAAAAAQFEGDVPLSEPLRRVREAGYTAFVNHRPSQYGGPVTFLRAGTPLQFPGDPVRAWGRFLGNLNVHTLPGDHYSMIKAYADPLASLLCSCMERNLGSAAHPPPSIA